MMALDALPLGLSVHQNATAVDVQIISAQGPLITFWAPINPTMAHIHEIEDQLHKWKLGGVFEFRIKYSRLQVRRRPFGGTGSGSNWRIINGYKTFPIYNSLRHSGGD